MSKHQIYENLRKEAHKQYGQYIYPVTHKKHLKDCVTIDDCIAMLWFNTPDHSTHIVVITIN